MSAAFVAAVFFALSAVLGRRSLQAVGPFRANVGRLLVGTACLGLYAHTLGQGWSGAGRGWLLGSGAIGMGLGDVALFMALGLIGSRLSVLMTQCLAAPIAIAVEWLWLGTALSPRQLAASAVILVGVGVALAPSGEDARGAAHHPIGLAWGLLAAVGQGLGAVFSRKAAALGLAAGLSVDGGTAAYQRICGGLGFTLAYFLVRSWLGQAPGGPARPKPPARAYGWVVANTCAGAIIGVSCYQWALATTPSGLVLPIVALTPLAIIPMSALSEGDRPTVRSVAGAVIAVGGAMALAH